MSLVVVAHPMMDLVKHVEADELSRRGLEPDSFTLARPEDAELFAQLEADDATKCVPGGAGLNSLRAAAWWLRVEAKTVASLGFFGAVGCDTSAEVLRESIRLAGINARLQVCDGVPTAKSAILVQGKTRTMVTDRGAAKHTSLGSTKEFEGTFAPLLGPSANLVLTTGYYIAQDPAGARRLVADCQSRYVLALTLAATFAAVQPLVAEFVRDCQIVFGTLAEASAFSKANGGPEDGDEVAIFIQEWHGCKDRVVVITNGPKAVLLASRDGLDRFAVSQIDPCLIVDDNGAGDAFAGAFLACHLCGGSTRECVAAGMHTAKEALQNIGCNFRDKEAVFEAPSPTLSCTIL